jgi:thiol-disulfide isomerase/thioredoxin
MNLPGGSDLWPDLVEALTEAYRTSADPPRYREGYKALLSNLKQRVTDREDWLTVMIALGDYHRTVTQDRWAALSAYEEAYRQGGSQRLIGAIKERLQSLRPRETDAPAPTFQISTAADSTIDLTSLRGNPVLLYFWAPWCSPCLRKFPKLNALQSDYRSANLRMIGLVNDVNDRTELISILDDHDVMWPQAITDDWPQESRTPERLYGVEDPGPSYALGHTVLIDRQGRIAAQGMDLGAIRDTLRAIMSQ